MAGILKCPWRHTGLSGQIWQAGPRDQVVPLDTRRALARPEFGDKTQADPAGAIIYRTTAGFEGRLFIFHKVYINFIDFIVIIIVNTTDIVGEINSFCGGNIGFTTVNLLYQAGD